MSTRIALPLPDGRWLALTAEQLEEALRLGAETIGGPERRRAPARRRRAGEGAARAADVARASDAREEDPVPALRKVDSVPAGRS
jgi:hypothetical protein